MLVISRFQVDPIDQVDFLDRARTALAALTARPDNRGGRVGRSVDEPGLFVLQTSWDGAGAYRRALSAYDVKLAAVPLLQDCIDEPSAFEVLLEVGEAGDGVVVETGTDVSPLPVPDR